METPRATPRLKIKDAGLSLPSGDPAFLIKTFGFDFVQHILYVMQHVMKLFYYLNVYISKWST